MTDIDHRSVVANHLDAFKAVALSYLKIIWVVCWSNLHRPCAVVHINVFICNHRNLTSSQRQLDIGTDQSFVTLVIRIDSHGSVTEQCFGTGGRHHDLTYFVECRIGNLIELALLGLVDDFDIRKARLVLGAIINHPLTSVYEPIFPQLFKCIVDCGNNFFIKSEDEVAPARPNAQRTELQLHIPPLAVDKIPDLGIQLLPRIIKTSFALFFQLFFIHYPGFEARMVCPWQIDSIVPL